jgi:polyhydroxyalkanoate synthesis regulator phasin
MSRRSLVVLVLFVFAVSIHAQRPQRRPAPPAPSPDVERKAAEPATKERSGERPSAPDSVTQLADDLAAIKSGSNVTKEQKEALANDLIAMADGATKPDKALVDELVADLYAALDDGELSTKEAKKLASDIEDVMNSANIPKSEVDKAIADAKAILLASGVTKADAQVIVEDLQAIAAELQGNASSTGGSRTKSRSRKPVPAN